MEMIEERTNLKMGEAEGDMNFGGLDASYNKYENEFTPAETDFFESDSMGAARNL